MAPPITAVPRVDTLPRVEAPRVAVLTVASPVSMTQ